MNAAPAQKNGRHQGGRVSHEDAFPVGLQDRSRTLSIHYREGCVGGLGQYRADGEHQIVSKGFPPEACFSRCLLGGLFGAPSRQLVRRDRAVAIDID